MILTLLSIVFAVISLGIAIINILFIAHHADLCGRYRYSTTSIQTENEIRRYKKMALILGAFVLFFIGLSFLADVKTATKMGFIFGGYKLAIPPFIWIISFLTPGKRVRWPKT